MKLKLICAVIGLGVAGCADAPAETPDAPVENVLELDEMDKVFAARPEDCIACKLCEIRCPDLAIEIETE